MNRLVKILGSFIIFIAVSGSYIWNNGWKLEISTSNNTILSLTYAIVLCIGLALIFYSMGIEERVKSVKLLIYYNFSGYFSLVALVYIFNIFFDNQIKTHKVFLSLILSTISCLIIYFYRLRKY